MVQLDPDFSYLHPSDLWSVHLGLVRLGLWHPQYSLLSIGVQLGIAQLGLLLVAYFLGV